MNTTERPKDKLCAKGLHCDHAIGKATGKGLVRKQRYRCCGCGMESRGEVRAQHGSEVSIGLLRA